MTAPPDGGPIYWRGGRSPPGGPTSDDGDDAGFIAALLVVAAIGFGIYKAFTYVPKWISDFAAWVGPARAAALSVVAVLLCGLLLFRMKSRHQVIYGLFEVGFACALAAKEFPISSPLDGFGGKWAALCAATYVVVRGYVNIAEGRAKRKAALQLAKKQAPQSAPQPNK
jgi:hypothetical protein